MTETTVSRRGLFKLVAGGQDYDKEPVQLPVTSYPRPPWARENREFLALCESCGLCIDACSERVLRPLKSENELLDGTPVLNLDYGQCTFCAECVKACSSGALDMACGDKVQTRAVITSRCVRIMGMPCEMCVDSCPEQALVIDSRSKPHLNSEICTGCGACSLACYSHAIAIEKLTRG